jgi:hypothetical protein
MTGTPQTCSSVRRPWRPGPRHEARASQDQWTCGARQMLHHDLGRARIEPLGHVEQLHVRQTTHIGGPLQRVGRQVQVDRSGSPRTGHAQRACQIARQRVAPTAGPGRLGDRCRHFRLRHFLVCAQPDLVGGRVARQQDHGGLRHPGGVQGGNSVGVPGPARDQRNSWLPGDTRPGIRHVHRRCFVPGMDQFDARIEHGIEYRHDVIAGESENALYAGLLQHQGECIGTTRFGLGQHLDSRRLRSALRRVYVSCRWPRHPVASHRRMQFSSDASGFF